MDFALAKETSPEGRVHVLQSDDAVELCLARIASWIYEKRTGDRQGALYILRALPPSAETDIAPTWMITQASAHSKAEYQIRDRVNKLSTLSKDKGKGGGGHSNDQSNHEYTSKGKGRGKGKK